MLAFWIFAVLKEYIYGMDSSEWNQQDSEF